MALEDLVQVVQTISALLPGASVNLSYYLVLAGFVILVGFAGFVITSLALRSFLALFNKPPSYAVKLVLLVGLILFLLGIIMP